MKATIRRKESEMELKREMVKPATGLADVIHGRMRALRVRDVATYLSVSERQVYKLAAERRIPCFRIGGLIRFDPMAVAGWLRQKMVPKCPGASRGKQTADVMDKETFFAPGGNAL